MQIENLFILHDNAYAKATWGSKGKPKIWIIHVEKMVFLDSIHSGCDYYNFSIDNIVNVSQPTVVCELKDYVLFGRLMRHAFK